MCVLTSIRRAAVARPLTLLLPPLLAACAAIEPPPAPRGEVQGEPASAREWIQSDVNRLVTLEMRDNLDSLFRLMDKLYKRNPAQLAKSGAENREAAITAVRDVVVARESWPALGDRRDIAALSHALDPAFDGDRVAAFIYACADMLVTAHGGKTQFHLLDGISPQYLFNAARNMEVAAWVLGSRKSASGDPLLLADEINDDVRNLSFEREFGKIIGRLDLLAVFGTEKYRRAAIGYVQNLAGGTFLQFLPVQAMTAP